MKKINNYIFEKLKINKNSKLDAELALIIYNIKAKNEVKTIIFDDFKVAKEFALRKYINYLDGYISSNRNELLELKDIIDSGNYKWEDCEYIINKYHLKTFLSVIDKIDKE